MSRQTVEERLSALESHVAKLEAVVRGAKRPGKDWRKTIGAFTDDPGMQQILKDAMQLRDEDRKKARQKQPTKRKRNG
ncbi:MAG TPA: hypothetical protein VGI40_21705 [Pirellulaceae bacterium]|jgi:hypothetical protein